MTPLEHTLEFLRPYLGRGCRVLEVGCGEGELAAAMHVQGCEVLALEPDRASAASARARGVSVVESPLEDAKLPAKRFDAVVFGRSLHHVHDLEVCLDTACRLVAPSGVLICEEFDVEAADSETSAWFYDQRLRLLPDEALPGEPDSPPLERWRIEHEHDPPLHTGGRMLAATECRFDVTVTSRVPYLYRYFGPRLDGRAGGETVANLHGKEAAEIARGVLKPVGLRWIGRPKL